jgi:hypothetical protein
MTDVFDDVIAERDALRQQVAMLTQLATERAAALRLEWERANKAEEQVAAFTQELKDSQAEHAEMRRRDAERVRAIGAQKVAAERQVAALTKALEQVRLFEPQLVETALAAVRGGGEPR